MKTNGDKKQLVEHESGSSKPRFKIEKLEERISPAKGGIPGPPDHANNGGGGGGGRPCRGCSR